MGVYKPVPLVRCRLDAPDEECPSALRYVPLAEFGLWTHLMQTRHGREVQIESVSLWIAEDPSRWNSGFQAEDLAPVLRVRIEVPGPKGVVIPVERYFPAETYPQAQEALLSHYALGAQASPVLAIPGYFVTAPSP